MLYIRLAAVAAIAAMLAAAGCGKSSTTATTGSAATAASTDAVAKTGSALSDAALIAKANAICGRVNAKVAAIDARTPNSNEFGQRVTQTANAESNGILALRGLTPSASMTNDWQQIVASAHTLAEETSQLGAYLQVKDSRSRAQLSNISAIEAQIRAITKRDGFKDCAQIF